jgi:hypothetical protein
MIALVRAADARGPGGAARDAADVVRYLGAR